MLIVIVIIGILAAAIIPRLNSARGRANDVARKADLNQVATALITYQLDTGEFPSTGTTINKISSQLTKWWMTSIPRDPWNPNTFSWVVYDVTPDWWYYAYKPITKNWIEGWWFVLMAQMESDGQANYVFCDDWSIDEITDQDDYNDIDLCQTISKVETGCVAATVAGDTNCQYSKLNQLRYIYKY